VWRPAANALGAEAWRRSDLGLRRYVCVPNATDDRIGEGKWQAGPAGVLMYQGIPPLQIGAIIQDQVSLQATLIVKTFTCF
jgi:hypothetical protein